MVIFLVLHGFCATIPASEDLSIDTRWPLSLGRSFCQDGELRGTKRCRSTPWDIELGRGIHFHVFDVISRPCVLFQVWVFLSGGQSEDLRFTAGPLLPCLVLLYWGAADVRVRWL